MLGIRLCDVDAARALEPAEKRVGIDLAYDVPVLAEKQVDARIVRADDGRHALAKFPARVVELERRAAASRRDIGAELALGRAAPIVMTRTSLPSLGRIYSWNICGEKSRRRSISSSSARQSAL